MITHLFISLNLALTGLAFIAPNAGAESPDSLAVALDSLQAELDSLMNVAPPVKVSHQAFGQGVEPSSEGSPDVQPVNMDSLVEVATLLSESGDAKGAAATHRTLGAIYLSGRRLDAAEEAFDRARRLDDSAASWFGLGLVAAAGDRSRKREAPDRFREALARDPKMSDARYRLALVLHSLREGNAGSELKRLVKADPSYIAGYLLLSEWAEPKPYGLEEALEWCERGLKANPDDPDLLVRREELKFLSGGEDTGIGVLMSYLKKRPHEIRLLPLIGQAHLKKERLGPADAVFRAYLDRVSPQERAFYDDISLVGSPEEIEAFRAIKPEDAPDFLRQFWARRDIDLISRVNRRRLEHYRRVWVARTQFSKGQTPWDRRGEIYIRYGEPYFRQRSWEGDFQKAMDRKVQAVLRQRQATRLYGGMRTDINDLLLFLKGNSGRLKVDSLSSKYNLGKFIPSNNLTTDMGLHQGPVYPLQAYGPGYTILPAGGNTPVWWESWIYPHIEGGIEFVFTDEFNGYNYDFAPIPTIYSPQKPSSAMTRLRTKVREEAPEQVFLALKSKARSLYLPEDLTGPLTSHVATVDFRGSSDSSRVEIYLEVPVEEITPTEQGWPGERWLVVYDKTWREVHRSIDRSPLQVLPGLDEEILDVMAFNLPPGDYFMAVKVRDLKSKRMQVIRDSLRVEGYEGDTLRMSGIEIARRIEPTTEEGKFVKQGLEVIPMPSLTFKRNKDVFLYFEVYNLTRDAQGRTHYQVDYTTRKLKGGIGNPILSGLGRLIGRRKKEDEITVSYELGGEEVQEIIHTALDLRKGKKGDHTLQVTVTDLNSGIGVSKQTSFVLR